MKNNRAGRTAAGSFHLIAGEEVCGSSYLIAVGLLRAQMNNSVSRDSGRGTLRDSDDGYYCI